MNINERVIVALDVKSLDEAGELVDQLSPYVSIFKIGLEIITANGVPLTVQYIQRRKGGVFLDGKFNDIPKTVGEAAAAASLLQVAIMNVHASSGIEAMAAAAKYGKPAKVLAVTVLTSLEENNAHLIFGAPSKAKVLQFARDALVAGIDGIICSPLELPLLRKQKELDNLIFVTPGVRPAWSALGDQKRVMTPGEAIAAGATALVIGRPITKPPTEIGTPVDAIKRIHEEIETALENKLNGRE